MLDARRWIDAFADQPVRWYRDKASGKTMDRPGWNRLERDMEAGKVSAVVVWRLDRLGRTAAGLTALFERLQARRINLVSIRDSLDLSTAAGRLMANVLASVSVYENEVRSERIGAGQARAREAGKQWGGRKPGVRVVVKPEQIQTIARMHADGQSRATGLSRPTIYSVLESL